jgi:hypothetical protein
MGRFAGAQWSSTNPLLESDRWQEQLQDAFEDALSGTRLAQARRARASPEI